MGPTHGENTIPQCGKVGSRAYTAGNFQSMRRKKPIIGKVGGRNWEIREEHEKEKRGMFFPFLSSRPSWKKVH